MCFGNDGPDLQYVPPPPPEIPMMDFINFINGVETVTVTDPNGVKRRVTQRLPRKPEEQQLYDFGSRLIAKTASEFVRLNKYNPQSAIDFQPLIQTFNSLKDETVKDISRFADFGDLRQEIAKIRDIQSNLIDENFGYRARSLDENLARRGLGSSSTGREARSILARQQELAHQEGYVRSRDAAINLAAKQLATDADAFNIREQGRQRTMDAARYDYGLRKEDEEDQERRRLQAMQEQQGLYKLGSDIVRYDEDKALKNTTQQDSLNTYLGQNNIQNAKYGAEVNAINANNAAAIQEYNNRSPGFFEWGANLLGGLGTSMWTAAPNTMAGRVGKKFF